MARRLINRKKKKKKKKKKTVQESIVYNLSQQKRFFVDVTLKSSMTHYRLTTFGYLRHFPLQNSVLTAIWWHKKFSFYCNFLGQKRSFTLKTRRGNKKFFCFFCVFFLCVFFFFFFFAHNVTYSRIFATLR